VNQIGPQRTQIQDADEGRIEDGMRKPGMQEGGLGLFSSIPGFLIHV
jgi:hypothetical protein